MRSVTRFNDWISADFPAICRVKFPSCACSCLPVFCEGAFHPPRTPYSMIAHAQPTLEQSMWSIEGAQKHSQPSLFWFCLEVAFTIWWSVLWRSFYIIEYAPLPFGHLLFWEKVISTWVHNFQFGASAGLMSPPSVVTIYECNWYWSLCEFGLPPLGVLHKSSIFWIRNGGTCFSRGVIYKDKLFQFIRSVFSVELHIKICTYELIRWFLYIQLHNPARKLEKLRK